MQRTKYYFLSSVFAFLLIMTNISALSRANVLATSVSSDDSSIHISHNTSNNKIIVTHTASGHSITLSSTKPEDIIAKTIGHQDMHSSRHGINAANIAIAHTDALHAHS